MVWYTYVPPPGALKKPEPAAPKPPKPEVTSFYNYSPANAGRLNSALPSPCYAYVPVAYVNTPNVPAQYAHYFAPQAHLMPVIYPNPYGHPVATPAAVPPKAPEPMAKPADNVYFYGATKEEVDIQNRAIHQAHAKPIQLVPYEPSAEQQFWCRELNGSYNLRTTTECMTTLQPGEWAQSSAGVPYFVRKAPALAPA